MPFSINIAFLVSAVVVVSVVFITKYGLSSSTPPGPPADAFIGHARKIPESEAWKTYGSWSKLYGQNAIYTLTFS